LVARLECFLGSLGFFFSASDQLNYVELIELAVRKFPPLPSSGSFYLLRTGAKSELIHINGRAFSEISVLCAAWPCSAGHALLSPLKNPRSESRRANAMHSRITAKSAGNSNRGGCSASQHERRIAPSTIEGDGVFVADAIRGRAGAGIMAAAGRLLRQGLL